MHESTESHNQSWAMHVQNRPKLEYQRPRKQNWCLNPPIEDKSETVIKICVDTLLKWTKIKFKKARRL